MDCRVQALLWGQQPQGSVCSHTTEIHAPGPQSWPSRSDGTKVDSRHADVWPGWLPRSPWRRVPDPISDIRQEGWILSSSLWEGRVIWGILSSSLQVMASFEFTIHHHKGTLHKNAYSLLRAPHAALPTPPEEKILVSNEGAVVAALQAPPASPRKR